MFSAYLLSSGTKGSRLVSEGEIGTIIELYRICPLVGLESIYEE
jgi:hypothetical protein